MTKLHIGCGRHHLEGWINIDIREIKGVDVVCDITQGLPFEEESVDLIFSEHVFEHFTLEEGQSLLQDWYRVLRPRGGIRIAVPGLEEIIDKYLSGDWRKDPWVKSWGYSNKTGAEYINAAFYKWDHKCIYDSVLLSKSILEAGFTKVCRQQYRKSGIKDLENLERRSEKESTLIIEGTK